MKVTISYRTNDRGVVDELDQGLMQQDINTWIDHKGIRPGRPWRKEIFAQLRQTEVCIVVLSGAYLQSEHCRMEAFLARSFGSILVPFMIEDCFGDLDRFEETKGLGDIFMMRLHHLSAVGLPIDRSEAFRRTIQGVQHALRRCSHPDHQVYVSYSGSLDGPFATALAETLANRGIASWVATKNVMVGENWRDAQVRGLSSAALQIVVLDENMTSSRVLRTELVLAEALGIPVVTVLPPRLKREKGGIDLMMNQLNAGDQTYRRLTETQFFSPDRMDPLFDFVSGHLASHTTPDGLIRSKP